MVEFDCDYALVKWLNKSEKNVYGVVSVDLIHHTDELVFGTTYKVSYNHKKFSATLVKLGKFEQFFQWNYWKKKKILKFFFKFIS